MKTLRFAASGRIFEGTWEGGQIFDSQRRPWAGDAIQFLPPIVARQVIGLALNYQSHAAELNLAEPEDPVLFFKPLTTLTGHGGNIVYPHGAQYCHYETELAVVIGRAGRKIREDSAWDYILGYTVANDLKQGDSTRFCL